MSSVVATEATIPALFEGAVEANPDKVWLVQDDQQFTFAESAERIGSLAAALLDAGVGRGDLVLATARNEPDYLFLWLAAMRIGAIYLPVNPRGSAEEIRGLMTQTEPGLVVTDPDLHGIIGDPLPGVVRCDIADLARGRSTAPPIAARADEPAVLVPTSGTTGRSKLVTQTQRAYTWAGEGFPYWMGLGPEDRLMTSLPLFHINAPAYSVLGSVAARAGLVLLPRFSATSFFDSARLHGATEFNAIGAMLEILMTQPPRPDDADNPIRRCYTGPSPSEERQHEIERRFGFEIVCGYGLSESPYGLIWEPGTRPYGTLGKLRQHPALGVVNEGRVVAEGQVVEPGGTGELQLRNPTVMLGYWQMPEETSEVLRDGWLHTGDLVRLNEDGTYTFVSRIKEVIRRRGENLAPAEVEAAIAEHPQIDEVAVVGVPSPLSDEDVKAFLIASSGLRPDPADVRKFAAERLTPYKVPRYIEYLDEMPHTPTGRLAKHQLPVGFTGSEWDGEI